MTINVLKRKMAVFWGSMVLGLFLEAQSKIALIQTSLPTPSVASRVRHPQVEPIPYRLSGGVMLLEGRVDQKTGTFILDTGAPYLALNQTGSQPTVKANSISAQWMIGQTRTETLQIQDRIWRKLAALEIDLKHLERSNDRALLGLIGYDVLKQSELLVDPDQKLLYLLDPGKNIFHQTAQPEVAATFQLADHLPLVELKIQGQTFYFGLDTGSETNLIEGWVLARLDSAAYEYIGAINIRGLDQQAKRRPLVAINQVALAGATFDNLTFTQVDFSHLNQENLMPLAGVLGGDFLNRYKYSINYPHRRFYLWEKIRPKP